MKLSFVIPAYNEEALIGKCLESILKQTASLPESRQDVEIIVANNASTDRTKEIAASYGVLTVDEPRKGVAAARQAGYLSASGDLIANIDADTELPAGWIERVFEEFEKNKNLVGLSGPFIYTDISKFGKILTKFFYAIGFLAYLINHKILGIGAVLQGGNFILRRTALEKINGFNINIKFYGEETDIARRISKVGDVKFTFKLPMYTTARRLNKEGILKTGAKYAINYAWMIIFKKPYTGEYTDVRLNYEKKMNQTARKREYDGQFAASTIIAAAMLIFSLIVNFYAGRFAQESASNYVTDVVLDNIPVFNVGWIFVYGALIFIIVLAALCLAKPRRVPFVLKSMAFFILIRSVFISLTHISPFPDAISINYASDVVKKFTFGGDLFFSWHTGAPFLMALVFHKNKRLKILFAATAVFFGTVVLLGHLHYSIDVLSAFFITYAIYEISKAIFKNDKILFESED